ncbi:MAG: hypothetical protein WC634_05225 [archaeon]
MNRKRRVSKLGRKNIKGYRTARKAGWKLFREAKLAPWERKLAAKALTVALRTHLGMGRKSNESAISVKLIIPFAAQGLKAEMKGKIPSEQWSTFSTLMDWYAANPLEFNSLSRIPPKEIRGLGKLIDTASYDAISTKVSSAYATFGIENTERPYTRNKADFEKDLEFQLNHDIFFAILFVKNFLIYCRK